MDTTPDKQTIQQRREEAETFLTRAEALVISDDATLASAAQDAQEIARGKHVIVEFFKPMKAATHAAHQAVCKQESGLLVLWDKASEVLRKKMASFQQARLEAARKKADDDAAAARKREEEDRLAEAVRLEGLAKATGDDHYQKVAEKVLDTPAPIVVKAKAYATPTGVSFTPTVDVECENILSFLAAVAAKQVVLDSKTLGRIEDAVRSWVKTEAKQRGEAFNIPGWIKVEDLGVKVRR